MEETDKKRHGQQSTLLSPSFKEGEITCLINESIQNPLLTECIQNQGNPQVITNGNRN